MLHEANLLLPVIIAIVRYLHRGLLLLLEQLRRQGEYSENIGPSGLLFYHRYQLSNLFLHIFLPEHLARRDPILPIPCRGAQTTR